MIPFTPRALAALAVLLVLPSIAPAQKPDSSGKPKHKTAFYDSETPITIRLTTNIKQIRGDRKDGAPWRDATITIAGEKGGAPVTAPVKVRTRGIWRLNNCEFPPMRLNFIKDSVKETVLKGLDKPKLVNFCRNNARFDQYTLQELQLYRIYQLITPVSHKVRLLRATYVDSATGKEHATRWAIMLEEPEAMAERAGGEILDAQGADEEDLDPAHALVFSVFQYLIANTDFSVYALHNAELVQRRPDFAILPVAYDFDFAGAVNAPYASPDPKLVIRHVRQRLYRGQCATPEEYARVFAMFNEKKAAIYALYEDDIGKLLNPDIRHETLKYFDEFYEIINDPKRAKTSIADACIWKRLPSGNQ